ncbi:hypothetical protein [Maribellus maritimus]|uniref:hypothetical protein n=1 Tax=Maribellus maritimus TaxID=2870838 RepID=UPI001EEC174C|nr:hypothetical protein [Maribellus maritimus]MCG6186632.1 hypothetical protein [Maribellus maritimus]
MKTDRLEEFVKNNREEFDQFEPSARVWKNINQASHQPKMRRLNTPLLRVAAVLVLAVIFTVTLYRTNIFTQGNYARKIKDPELRELVEAEAYYAHQVNGKLKEIKKCYYTNPELKSEIETDLTELEQMYNVLKGDLRENISNKAVIEAMIDNNRTRLKLVDEVLEQINC